MFLIYVYVHFYFVKINIWRLIKNIFFGNEKKNERKMKRLKAKSKGCSGIVHKENFLWARHLVRRND